MSDDELLDKLKKDIPQTGFVTEMLVTAMLKAEDWNAVDHTYYMDKDENKGREIDVVAVKSVDVETDKRKVTLTLALSIEIKKSQVNREWCLSHQEPRRKAYTTCLRPH